MSSISSLKPGQNITCEVTKVPSNEDAQQTIEKLMRKDINHKRSLRKAQHKRAQRINIYNRGNRDWVSREKPARVVRVTKGAKWTMLFTPDLMGEMRNVEKYIKIG